ncbi:MAG: bifunctional phosphoglucose/phosphomannose isomerase [Candidatus Eisenbacteria bacterium]
MNDAGAIRQGDPGGMSRHLESFPAHLRDAQDIGRRAEISVSAEGVSAVVVLGMGGSAIGGDLASGLLAGELRVPLAVNRGYDVPAYVGPDTLVFVSSYSGNTEETLSAYEAARARRARIVCATTGGEVARLAAELGHDRVTIPGGLPPRAALAYGLVPTLVVLARLGLTGGVDERLDDAVSVAEDNVRLMGLDVPLERNPAKQLAAWFRTGIPVIYGTVPLTGVVATRWAGQISENSKTVAHVNVLPEMNHNEIVGWSGPRALAGEGRVVFLRDEGDHARVAHRIAFTRDEIARTGAQVREVESRGATGLGRMISLVGTGDFASLYLATLNGVDPTPVEPIDRLKRTLAEL